ADITELAGQFRPMMGSAGFDAKSGIVNSRTSPRGGRKGTFFFATRTMYCTRTGENQPGSITVLITWMTPLDCITLLMVISAVALGVDDPNLAVLFLQGQRAALHRFKLRLAAAGHDALTQVLGGEAAWHDVIGQHASQCLSVLGLEQRRHCAVWQFSERV